MAMRAFRQPIVAARHWSHWCSARSPCVKCRHEGKYLLLPRSRSRPCTYSGCRCERVNPIFSTVLSQNSKLLLIAQLHPRSTEHLMSNIHLHNTIQHAFAALMQVQTSHLCMTRTSCTHHHQQRRRQRIIVAVPTETKLGSTTFRFGSEHERKMSSIYLENIKPGRGSMISYEGGLYHHIFHSIRRWCNKVKDCCWLASTLEGRLRL